MAIYENPKHYKGPVLQQVTLLAKDGFTWQADQFCRLTASGVVPCKTQATSVQGQFAQSQATASSSTKAVINLIPSNETKFKIYATSGGSDAVANAKYIGKNVALGVNSCICSASVSGQTDAKSALFIEDVYVNKDDVGTTTGATPGIFIASVRPSFLTTAGL
jgi:hypothetical protein